MTTLADRIRIALDETERVARAADGGSWEVGPTFGGRDNRVYVRQQGSLIDTIGTCVIAGQVSNTPQYRANAQHIALHDPERELRMVAAHRKILDLHEPSEYRINYGIPRVILQCNYCASLCHSGSGLSCDSPDAPYPCETVQIVAEAYGVEA